MSKTLDQMLKDKAALDAEINALREQEKAGVVAKMKAQIEKYGLTADDLGFVTVVVAGKKASKPVAPKYKDKNGNTWTGRGFKPVWVREFVAGGGDLNTLLVAGAKAPVAAKKADAPAAKKPAAKKADAPTKAAPVKKVAVKKAAEVPASADEAI